MKSFCLTATFLLVTSALRLIAADVPEPTVEPKIVNPGPPPADAIVLFDGKDLSKWESTKGGEAKWDVLFPAQHRSQKPTARSSRGNTWVFPDGRQNRRGANEQLNEGKDGVMVVTKTGSIQTKERFGDCQLHIEWATPAEVKGEGQGRGNSGIFFQGRYEVQVLDSYENKTYFHGQAGSLYKQHVPLVNASKKPGEWQTYDIIFHAPKFNEDGTVKQPGRATVLHNGVLVQNHAEILGTTTHAGAPKYVKHEDKLPILLQDHGDPIRFRNIWIRPL